LYGLPLIVSIDPARIGAMPASIVVPLGDDASFGAQIHRIRADPLAPPMIPAAPNAQYVVIGSLIEDSDNVMARPGPLLLAWALSDLLAGRSSAAPVPLNRPLASLLLGLMGALASWSVFAATFAGMRSKVSAPNWTLLAVAICLLSCLIGLGLLILIQFLVVASGRVAPLAWPTACVLAASLLAMASGVRWINDTRSRLNLERGAEEQAIAYDVFISYAHDPIENREWVRRHVAAPLSGLRHADGRPIRIFFDERSIEAGRQWKREIELALLGTCCFIPIYSERYFDRPYCREEIELADQLRIEGRLDFVPIARVTTGIPERYLRKVQYLDASVELNVGAVLTAQVKTLIDRVGPPGSIRSPANV
jgi:TIR domain